MPLDLIKHTAFLKLFMPLLPGSPKARLLATSTIGIEQFSNIVPIKADV